MYIQSNPFSESIKFRQGSPIKLIDVQGTDSEDILLNEKALNILRSIEEPICVISIVGSYRRGKSYFANTLHGRHDGFKLGSSVKGCTKGIDMWDTPFLYKGKRVVVLDCEGIDDPCQEVPWANKLFIFCLAISSTFVFNINGVVGRDDIGKLCLMTNIASHIQRPDDPEFAPNLVVLLRDFQFDHPPDFVDYFLKHLSRVDSEAAEGVKEFFGKFKVRAIPSPGLHQEAMKDMSTIATERLDPVFIENIENSVDDILSDLSPKYINKLTMTGTTFVAYLQDCVLQMNDSGSDMPLSIPSAYEITILYVAQNATEICLKNYEYEMNSQMVKDVLPISWDSFDKIHIDAFQDAVKNFVKRIVGSAEQIRSFQEDFCEKILISKERFHQMNSEAIYKHNNKWAHKLWKENVMIGLKGGNHFTPDEYEDAISLFEQIYGTEAMPGEEAGQVLIEFKEHQYKEAVETLKYYGSLHETLAEEISERQEMEMKYYDLVKKEKQLRTEISNLKSENEKIKQPLEERIKDLEEGIRNQTPNDQDELRFQMRQHAKMLDEMKDRYETKFEKLEEQLKKKNKKKENFWKSAGDVVAPIIVQLVSKLLGIPSIPFPY